MSMEITEKVTFSGNSKINGVVAEQYSATIDKDNPSNLTFSRIIPTAQMQLRKDNREQCRADMAAFEDDVYDAQDALIETDSVKSEDTSKEDE